MKRKKKKVCVCLTPVVRICDEDEFKQEAAGEDERSQANGMEQDRKEEATRKFGGR